MTPYEQVVQAQEAKINALSALIRKLSSDLQNIKRNGADPFAHIPGRRVWYVLAQQQTFNVANQNGQAGQAMNLQVSEDGPFVATHFPVFAWKPSLPANATNFGQWRPVFHGPLPTQAVTTDLISISYQLNDSGSGRNLQSQYIPPVTSRLDRLCPLPFPTIFKRAGVLQCTPFYEDIDFNSSGTATTAGTLVVAIPGYKIVPDADFMGLVP